MAAMPRAFIDCCRAYWAWRRGDLKQAGLHSAAAEDLLGELYPVEKFWVGRLEAAACGAVIGAEILHQLQRRPHPVFNANGNPFAILDEHLLEEPLPPCAPPFAELEPSEGNEYL
jgi:hypothetical protein